LFNGIDSILCVYGLFLCIGNLHTLLKCQSCSRRLRLGLFNPGSTHCHNCTRKKIIAQEIRQRGAGRVQFSVNNTFIIQNLPAPPGQMDPVVYLNSISDQIRASLTDALKMHTAIKFYLTVSINMMRFVGVSIHREVGHFVSIPAVLLHESDIDELVQRAVNLIMERADAFLRFGSGWTFDDVKSVDIHTCAYNVIGGSSFIPTPARFKNRCLINVQNSNERCFAYSVLAGIFPAKNNVCAPWKYEKYMSTLNFDGISFPLK
jgi:hypothetical protein